MYTITLKSVPDDLYSRLKEAARRNRRSLNQEALFRIEQAGEPVRRDSEEILRRIRELRQAIRMPEITDEFINEAKRMARE